MKTLKSGSTAFVATLTGLLPFAPVAHALTVPDSGTCTGLADCLSITSTGQNALAINGVAQTNSQSWGVVGSTVGGPGGYGRYNSAGVEGISSGGTGSGVQGVALSGGYGVYGYVSGNYNNLAAVYGDDQTSSNTSVGVQGHSVNFAGVLGTGPMFGVQGSSNGVGVYGISGGSYGMHGVSQCATGGTCVGVYGESWNGNGVWGKTNSPSNAAVVGVGPNPGIGVYAQAGTAFYGAGDIDVTGQAYKPGGGPWQNLSDSRVKKDIRSFDPGLPELMRIRPIRYKYNGLGGTADDGKEYAGVIAQELEKVMPTMVGTKMARLHASDAKETAIKVVDGNEFTYLLIKAVQEQQKTIERQEARLASLERGRPMMSSISPLGNAGSAVTLALLPVGIVVAIRRRKA